MSTQQDLIKLNEVIAQCNQLLKEQSDGWKSIVDEIKKVNSNAPSSYIKMQQEVANNLQRLEALEQKYNKTKESASKIQTKINTDVQKTLTTGVSLEKQKQRELALQERNRIALERTTSKVLEQNRAYNKLQTSWRNAQKALADSIVTDGLKAKSTQRLQKEFNELDRRIKQVDSATKNYSKNVGNYQSAFSGLGSLGGQLAGALGWAGAITTVVSLGRSAYDTTKKLQILHKSMELGSKDAEAYASNVEFLKKVTEDYGLELITTSQAYNKFYIASKNKLALEEIQLIFEKISKSASLMGLSVYDQEGIFKALEQMMSKGTVQAEELRGQLGDRLPGAFEIMANAMGVSTEKLGDMMKNGEVIASEVLPKFAIELERAFGADKVTKVDNLTASSNRMKNAWTELVENINGSRGIISNVFMGISDGITDLIKDIIRLNTSWSNLMKQMGAESYNKAYDSTIGSNVSRDEAVKKAYDLEARQRLLLANQARLNKELETSSKFVGSLNFFKGNRSSVEVKKDLEATTKELQKVNGELTAYRHIANGIIKDKVNVSDVVTGNSKKGKESKPKSVKDLSWEIREQQINNEIAVTKNFKEQMMLRYQLANEWYQNQLNQHKGNYQAIELATKQYTGRLIALNQQEYEYAVKIEDTKAKKILEIQKMLKDSFDKLHKDIDAGQRKRLEDEAKNLERIKNNLKSFFEEGTDGSLSGMGFGSLSQLFDEQLTEMWKNTESTTEKMAMAFQVFGNIANDVFAKLNQASQAYYDRQYERLEREKEVALTFAGDSSTGRAEIEKQYDEKKRQIEIEQAKRQKRLAIFQAQMNTAMGVVSAIARADIFPYNFVLAGIIGAMGLAQTAIIASQPLPEFWKGTDNAPEGFALTQEKGAEMITDKNGNIKTLGSNKGAQLTYLNKGDKVLTATETQQRLSEMLMSGSNGSVNIETNNGLSKEDMREVLNDTLAKQPKHNTIFDERGVSKFIETNNQRKIIRNRNARI